MARLGALRRKPAVTGSLALAAAAGVALVAWLAAGRPDLLPARPSHPEPGDSPAIVSGPRAPAAAAAPGGDTAGAFGSAGMGRPAPDFTARDLDGRPLRLSALRGRPVLINFWATWCPPCREEMPQIEAFVRRYGDRMEVVGVAVGETPEQVRAFLRKTPYSWRFVADPDLAVADRYGIFGIPSSYFVDREGVVRAIYTGAMNADQIRAFARQAGVDVD